MDIEQNRRDTADNIYENFDFSYSVVDANGWSTDGLEELSKTIYFEDPEDRAADTIKGVLTITFERGTAVPTEAVCYVRGEEVGNITGGALADYAIENGSGLKI